MRDLETIDSELRLLAAVCREQDGVLPSIGPVDDLLDERLALAFLHRVIVDMTADAIDTAGSL